MCSTAPRNPKISKSSFHTLTWPEEDIYLADETPGCITMSCFLPWLHKAVLWSGAVLRHRHFVICIWREKPSANFYISNWQKTSLPKHKATSHSSSAHTHTHTCMHAPPTEMHLLFHTGYCPSYARKWSNMVHNCKQAALVIPSIQPTRQVALLS